MVCPRNEWIRLFSTFHVNSNVMPTHLPPRVLLATLLFTVAGMHAHVSQAQVSGVLQHDGIERSYLVYAPSGWAPGTSLPLVFVLHGTTQDGQRIMDISSFNDLAEQHQFIAVYPDGLQASWGTGLPGASTADDLGFLEALATQLSLDYGIDSSRVYSCGFSAGGYMSYRLACESTRCFAAVASVSGTMMPAASAACAPIHPTPVMQIHGTSDIVVSYNGGVISGLGAEEVMDQWNAFDNCPADPVVTSVPNTSLFDFSTVDELLYSPCDLNIHNVLLRVNGGGHQWPGTNILLGGIGNINQDINASERIWSFFSNYSCSDVSTGMVSITRDECQAVYDSATQRIIITWNGPVRAWQLSDATGRIVQKGVLTPGTHAISTLEYPPGVFLLIVPGAEGRFLRFAKS